MSSQCGVPRLRAGLLTREVERESSGLTLRGIFSSVTLVENPERWRNGTRCFAYIEVFGARPADDLILTLVDGDGTPVMIFNCRLSDDPDTHPEWLPHTAVVPLNLSVNVYGRHQLLIKCAGSDIGAIPFEVKSMPRLPAIDGFL